MAAPGLELLYELVSAQISQPQDALVCFIHWELISNGLLCLGKSEKAGAQETGSERLPSGWSDNKELYTLRYGAADKKFLLKALVVDATLMVNTMDLQTDKVSDVTLNIDKCIDGTKLKQFHGVYKNPAKLHRKLQNKMLSALFGPKEKAVPAPKPVGEPEKPLKKDPLRDPPTAPVHPLAWTGPSGNIPYGVGDLDPLGGHSGGMIFDPFHGGPRIDPTAGLPPGAVPPGARFDPFGPIGSGRPEPDPDHLPPPGYDDMFM